MTDLETRIAATLRSTAAAVDGHAVPPVARVHGRADRVRRGQRVRLGGAVSAVAAALVAGGLVLARPDGDPLPPVGGTSTTAGSVPTATTTTTTTVPPAEPGAFGEAFTPTAADRVATLPESKGYTPNAYRVQGPSAEQGEVYLGPPAADGSRAVVMVAGYAVGEGGSCVESRAAAAAPDLPDTLLAVRCAAGRSITVQANRLPAATVDRLAAGITDAAPTRLDTAGTDLVSVGVGPANPRITAVSYVHPTRPGLELTTIAEGRYDMAALVRSASGLRDAVDVDVAGRPGLQYTSGPNRMGGPDVTVLTWSPEPGLTATIMVEGPSDELVAIARDVVVRPGDEVDRELAGRFVGPSTVPQTTTTSTLAADGSPVAGLAAIGLLPTSDGWSPIEYQVIPAPTLKIEQYVGPVRPDGDRPTVTVQASPSTSDSSFCSPPPEGVQVTRTAQVNEIPVGSTPSLVGSRCIGETSVTVIGRLVDRAMLERLLGSIQAGAPTGLDTAGTGLVSNGRSSVDATAVRVRYAHPDGGPGATVMTTLDDPSVDVLERARLSMGPVDAERIDLDGAPALLSRSVVEGNVAWTNLMWRPAPGVIVTVMVSGVSDRLPAIARSLVLRPAGEVHRELRALPTYVPPS